MTVLVKRLFRKNNKNDRLTEILYLLIMGKIIFYKIYIKRL